MSQWCNFFLEINSNFVNLIGAWVIKCNLERHVHCLRSRFFGFNTTLYSCHAIWTKKDCKNYTLSISFWCVRVCVRERECVCDFSFIFFYGHFGPKHPWRMGDNLTASYIRRTHVLTIIFFLDKEVLPEGKWGGGYEEGHETVSRGNPITEIDLFIIQTPVFYCKIYYS